MLTTKTYVNAWATTHRYHESIRLPCIFGCNNEKDTLSHYLSCDRLWRVVAKHSRVQIRASILDKLGVKDPMPERFKNLALAFAIYHAMKLSHRNLIDSVLANRDFHELAAKAKQLAKTHNNLLTDLIPK